MGRLLASALCVCLAVGTSAGAAAQQPDSNAEQQGKAKFDAAREALKQGDTKGALVLFQASLALKKTTGTLLNLAYCEEKVGLLASASKHYQEVLNLLPGTDERVPIAIERMAAIEPRIPTLRIRLDEGAPSSTTVLLGERELAAYALDTDMQLDPGPYTITVSAPGSTTKRYDVMLVDGKKETIVVAPVSETSSTRMLPPVTPTGLATAASVTVPPSSPAPPSILPSPSPVRTAGFVFLGVAGAAAVAGAVTGGVAIAKRQELGENCPGIAPRNCNPALHSLYTDGKGLADISTAMFALTGAALAGGTIMLLVGSRPKISTHGASLAIGPGSIYVRGRF